MLCAYDARLPHTRSCLAASMFAASMEPMRTPNTCTWSQSYAQVCTATWAKVRSQGMTFVAFLNGTHALHHQLYRQVSDRPCCGAAFCGHFNRINNCVFTLVYRELQLEMLIAHCHTQEGNYGSVWRLVDFQKLKQLASSEKSCSCSHKHTAVTSLLETSSQTTYSFLTTAMTLL